MFDMNVHNERLQCKEHYFLNSQANKSRFQRLHNEHFIKQRGIQHCSVYARYSIIELCGNAVQC